MAFRNNSLECALLVILAGVSTSCAADKNNNDRLSATSDASSADSTIAAAVAGSVTLHIKHDAPIWIRVDGNICPALTVATKAGSTVATQPLPTTCCTCGVAFQQAVYRKIAAATVLPLKWDGLEFFTVNTGNNCTPLRNETRPVVPGDYVGTLHWSIAAPVGANCHSTENGDVACNDECEPTQATLVPFTLRSGADTTVEVTLPPR